MAVRLVSALALGVVFANFSGSLARADKIDKRATPVAQRDHAPSFDEARARAQTQRKTLVLEFGARWCGPCKEFDARVIPQPAVQRALSTVLYVHYDAETPPGQPAARALKVVGYPTFIAIGQDGRVIDRIEGYRGAREFIDWISRVAIDFESDETIQVRISRDGNDAEALLVQGRRQAQRGQDAEAEASLSRAVTAARTLGKPRDETLGAAADYELRVVRLRRLLKDAPRKEMAEHLIAFPRSPNADAAFRELTRRAPVDATILRAIERYVDARIESFAQDKEQKAQDALNEAVYACLRVAAYDTAERAARKLLASDEKNPLFLDTLAEVLHLRGDKEKALSMSNRAVAAADRQGENGKEIRGVLLKNQARFARATPGHPAELPAELLSNEEDDTLPPWEKSPEVRRQ